jgi:Tn3 transposase DDE domain
MGLGRMAEVSGLSHSSMMTTARNYLRVETLHAANDAITNAIAKEPVFHLYAIAYYDAKKIHRCRVQRSPLDLVHGYGYDR